MKQLLLIFIGCCFAGSIFSQSSKIDTKITAEDYWHIARKQKKTGWIMLGGGAALVTLPALIFLHNTGLEDNNVGQKYLITVASMAIGGLLIIGSIPVFISAAKNKGKALSLSANITIESMKGLSSNSFAYQSYPAVSIRIKW